MGGLRIRDRWRCVHGARESWGGVDNKGVFGWLDRKGFGEMQGWRKQVCLEKEGAVYGGCVTRWEAGTCLKGWVSG